MTSFSLRRHAHGPLAERLMHMAHKSGKTSGVSKSSSNWLNYTGFPGDACIAFFNVPLWNKDAVTLNPLTEKESRRVYNCAYRDLLNAGFLKVCKIFKVRGIESFKYVRVLHTSLLLWWHFHAPKHDAKPVQCAGPSLGSSSSFYVPTILTSKEPVMMHQGASSPKNQLKTPIQPKMVPPAELTSIAEFSNENKGSGFKNLLNIPKKTYTLSFQKEVFAAIP